MTFLYRALADIVVVVHSLYVLFVIGGLLAVLIGYLRGWTWIHNPWFRFIHLAMISIVVLEAWLGIVCPLTSWENSLRRAAGQEEYRGAFIADFVHELLFFQAPPWVFTACYTGFGIAVAATFWLVPVRFADRSDNPS